MASRLTDRQKKFVDEYLVDLNATQAAIRAGYSPKTANRIASENLLKPDIQAKIQKRQDELKEKTEITQEQIIKELAAIAFSNGTDFAEVIDAGETQTVKFKATEKVSPEKRAAIAGIKLGTSGIEIKLCDKLRALELLGRYLGFLDNSTAGKATSLASVIMAAYEQRKEDDEC